MAHVSAAVKRISELADLLDASGQRHLHSKVMVFGVTASVVAILGLLLVVKADHLAWPDVAALGMLLVAPYGLDGYKTLLKLRSGAVPLAPPAAQTQAPKFVDLGEAP